MQMPSAPACPPQAAGLLLSLEIALPSPRFRQSIEPIPGESHASSSCPRCLLVSFFLVTSIASAPLLRAQLVGGTIEGDVVDPTNAVIEHATVVIRNDETGTERSLVTGADGKFWPRHRFRSESTRSQPRMMDSPR